MIYVARSARGRGVGRGLLEELVAESEAAGIWYLDPPSRRVPENEASLRLHESCGFRRVGVHESSGGTTACGATSCCSSAASSAVGQTP
jgi:phosphinothricin acetyltransferase